MLNIGIHAKVILPSAHSNWCPLGIRRPPECGQRRYAVFPIFGL